MRRNPGGLSPAWFLFLCLLVAANVGCRSGGEEEIVVPSGENSRFFTTVMRGVNVAEGSDRYTESDFATLKEWGANSVRYLITHGRAIDREPPHLFIRKDFERLDQILDWCEKYGLFLILNLHEMPGYYYVSGDDNSLWTSGTYQTLLVEFWKAIARRYRDRGDVVAYDILNEPHRTQGVWNDLAKRVTRGIRSIDVKHTIVVEAEGWAYPGNFENLEPTGDPNTVYSPHMYLPHGLTHNALYPYPGSGWDRKRYEREYKPVVDFQEKYGVPIWVGEFGCVRWVEGLDQWLIDQVGIFESHGWGWSWYSFREWSAMNLELSKDKDDLTPPPEEPSHLKIFKALLKGEKP